MKKKDLSNWQKHLKTIASLQTLNIETPQQKALRIAHLKNHYNDFVKYYFTHLVCDKKNKTIIDNAPFHEDAAQKIFSNPNIKAVFEWARGHAKSTQMSVLIPLWLLANNQFKTLLLISKSQSAAKRLLKDLQEELEHNILFIHDFDIQKNTSSWSNGEFRTNQGHFFLALGRGQSPRGIKNRGHRPDYIVIDDIDDDDIVRNPTRQKNLYNWLTKAVYNTMEGGQGRFIVVGNRIAKNAIIAQLAAHPAFYHSQVNAINNEGQASWHQHYSLQQLHTIRTTIGENAWQQEYMNNPLVEGAIFKDIVFINPLSLDAYTQIVCYTDPSFKNSNKSDFKASIMVGKTPDNIFHILDIKLQKASISDMVTWLYNMFIKTKNKAIVHFYMEANFIQDLLIKEFDDYGKTIGVQLPLRKDTRKKPDKFARIENLQPLFQNHKILFAQHLNNLPDTQTFIDQLLFFQRGSRINDDGPDALEGAIFILNNNPIFSFEQIKKFQKPTHSKRF